MAYIETDSDGCLGCYSTMANVQQKPSKMGQASSQKHRINTDHSNKYQHFA
jgi:hypothetical protein